MAQGVSALTSDAAVSARPAHAGFLSECKWEDLPPPSRPCQTPGIFLLAQIEGIRGPRLTTFIRKLESI